MKKIYMKCIGILFFVFQAFFGFSQSTSTFNATSTWTCPSGVTSVQVDAWGAGGGGGGTAVNPSSGGGGAGGSYSGGTFSVVPGTVYTVTVGSAGAAGANTGGTGGTGGDSWFNTATTIIAKGGVGGIGGVTGTTAGAGATGSSAGNIGTAIWAGGNGSNAAAATSGAGGGGGGTTAAGGNASGTTAGAGGTTGGGAGAAGRTTTGAGTSGSAPGGGGSGGYRTSATTRAGGAGGAGKIVLTYTCSPNTLPITEGFNSSTTPGCWSQQNVTGSLAIQFVTTTAGTSPSVSAPFEGSRMVFYNSYSNSTATRLVSLPLNTTGVPSVDVSFQWYYSSNGAPATYPTEGVTVQWSTDGVTWNDFAGNFVYRYSATTGWAPVTMTLPAGAANQANVFVGLKLTGNGGYDIYMDALSIKPSPACTAPAALAIGNITGTSASATFSSAGSSFILEYGATGFTPGTGTTAGTGGTIITGTASPIAITGLTPVTGYDVYIRQDCSASSNGYSANSAKVSFTTTVACPAPTAVTIGSITTSGASVTFTGSGSAYLVEYGPTGFTPGTGATAGATGTIVTGTSPVTLSGLTSATNYDVYVRQDCSASTNGYSLNSTKVSFGTACNSTGIPYIQDFESAVVPAIPTCTIRENVGTGNNWITSSAPGAGFTSKTLQYSYNSTNAANAWFYTQGINLTAGTSYQIAYKYGSSATAYTEKMKVAFGTSPSSTAMTTTLATHASINQGALQNNLVIFTVPSTGVYYFGFNVYSAIDQAYLYVDDINIDVAPACSVPTSVAFASVTQTSANVTFASSGSSFIVEYGAAGFTPGTGATAGTGGTVVTGAASPVSLTGLTAGTSYDVYVRQNCTGSGNGYSANTTKAILTTIPNCTTNVTPAAGATNVSISPNLTLTWTAAPGAASYDVYIGTVNPPTTLATNATTTTATLTGGASGTLYYWYIVPKNANGAATGCTSNVTSFTTTSVCTPSTTNGGTSGDGLKDFVLNGEGGSAISVIGAAEIATPGYIDLTATTNVTLAAGKAYAGTFKVEDVNDYMSVWIDFNNNGGFEANERVLNNLASTAAGTSTPYSIFIPASVAPGTYKMRVRDIYSSSLPAGPFDACASYTYGEGKDFTVTVAASGAPYTVSAVGGASCASVAFTTIDVNSNNNNMNVPILDATGAIVATLNANGNNLGKITSSVYRNTLGTVRQNTTGQKYLDRNITITPATQPTSNVTVTLYYTATELAALQSADPTVTSSNLDVSKFSTACAATAPSLTGFYAPHTANGTLGSDYFVSVSIPAFSTFFINGGGRALPISLEFSGRKQGAANILDWKVSSSTSTTLTLERSTDKVSFKAINSQTATASQMLNPFTYTDAAPAAGINYYRLKVTNADGESKYSNVVALINKEKGFELISVAPNPVQHSTVLSLSSVNAGRIELSVSDINGKVVMKQSVNVIAGNNPITLNFAALAAGTYQITAINADGDSKSTRFVKF